MGARATVVPEPFANRPLTLSIDAMGGDHGPPVIVAGAELALNRLAGRDVRFLLHGDAPRIEAELAKHPRVKALSTVKHSDRVIGGEEKAAQAMRRGKGTSLWNTIEALREETADAAISGGNTGALMAISKLILRMTGGLDRPAIVASWPTLRGTTVVLDVGANIESDAAQLAEFAIMGDAYYRAVHAAPGQVPKVGLLNVGSEEQKGHEDVREAHALLRDGGFDLDYYGFVEGDDIAKGTVEVVVTDGFTGNVALKTGEGLARFFATEMRTVFTSSLRGKLGALLAAPALRQMRARLEPPGGGPLLGLKGVVVKSHGGAEARGFADALVIAANLAVSDYAAVTARNMDKLGAALVQTHPASEAPQ